MSIKMLFAAIVEARMDFQCPAVQDAIDRLAQDWQHSTGRQGLLRAIREGEDDPTGCSRLGMLLLEAWKAADVLLVTGRSRESWLKQLDAVQSEAARDVVEA